MAQTSQLTSNDDEDYNLQLGRQWTADAARIIYVSNLTDLGDYAVGYPNLGIYSMNGDGGDNFCLTQDLFIPPGGSESSDVKADSEAFQLSSNGQIASYLSDGDTAGVYVLDLRGQERLLFEGLPYYAGYSLSWSPDGSSIVVVAPQDRYNPPESLYVINTITGETNLVLNDPDILHIDDPQWSP
jgi:Tol biopolymer transport system component